ncbi:hypothetical protein C1646_767702 [Rhizophagus diaphanus]|nr:hypothetical protein C1646_767702 [Rhizophagus diaphanus] [Rhizophagus sp. MUCL 43196]
MEYNKEKCKHLCGQLKQYKDKCFPFNIPYDDNYETPDLWINLSTQSLESLAKMSSYYFSNLKKELIYYRQNISTEEITEIINSLDFNEIEEADKDSNFEDSNIINDKSNDNVEVIIECDTDLSNEESENSQNTNSNNSDNKSESNSESEDYNYNPNNCKRYI